MAQVLEPLPGTLALPDLDDGADDVLVDLLGHDAVALVGGVAGDEMADPLGRGPELAARAPADQVQVGGQLAAGGDVDVDAVQVALDEGDQPREALAGVQAVVVVVDGVRAAVRRVRAVDDLVDAHEAVLVLDGAQRRGRPADAAAVGGVGAAGARRARREGVLAEVEPLVEGGVAAVGRLHVLVDFDDGDVEVEVEGQDGAGDEHDEDGEGGVLKIRDLDLHGAEFDAPPDVVVGRRRLEAHVLPVGRLDVLKVVRLAHV